MKIFISMPMRAKSTTQVKMEMNRVFEFIKEKIPEVELINSVIEGADSEIALKGDDSGIYYLGESLKRMSEASLVFFVNDWENYRGCATERKVADAYNKYCININVPLQ